VQIRRLSYKRDSLEEIFLAAMEGEPGDEAVKQAVEGDAR
jgi:hypothetical protein